MYLCQQDVEEITPEQIAFIKHQLGLDRPLLVQYVNWLGDVLTGDLGDSTDYQNCGHQGYQSTSPCYLHLGILAFILSIIIGIPLGVIAAARRGSWTG